MALAWNLLQMDLIPSTPVILVGPVWEAMTQAFQRHLVVSGQDLALLRLVETVDEAVTALGRATATPPAAPWRG